MCKCKRYIRVAAAALAMLVLSACGTAPQSHAGGSVAAGSAGEQQASSAPASSAPASSAPASYAPVVSTPATSTPAAPASGATALLREIVDAAGQGKVVGCEYAVDSITIDSIEAAWGTADESEYVASAKGTYYTFGKESLVFGANKGMLVFEIRSYAPELSSITRADVIGLLGDPEHISATEAGEAVIGYTLAYTGPASDMSPEEVKLKFVFPDDRNAAAVGHYMVLDPAQTANMMADDSGREW